jgi:hypothetical protein
MKDVAEKNRALLHFIVLPTILLTAGLLGGLRIDGQTRQFVFIAPPLVTLVLAILLGALFVRAGGDRPASLAGHRTANAHKRRASADADFAFLCFRSGIQFRLAGKRSAALDVLFLFSLGTLD